MVVARLKWIGVLALAIVPLISLAPARADDKAKPKEEEEEGEPKKPDKDRPKWTAGALFTRDTYPSTEVDRPLNLTGGMIEGRLDLQTDISEGSSFKTFITRLAARYGVTDTLELQAGADLTLAAADGLDKPKSIFVAVQQSILLDLLAVRLAFKMPVDPKFLFDIALGFPIKFRIVPSKVAIEALEEIIVIHTGSAVEGMGTPKPNINISIGGVFQILDNLALRLRGQVRINLDDTDLTEIPVQLDLQYTPINLFDFGLFIALDNLKAKDPEKPFDRRSIGLFARARY
jgi:hypothetical protein